MEEKSRVLFPGGSFIKNRIKYLENQYNMVYNLQYEGENLVFLKTSVDTVIQISIGYEATLHREERRVAA